MHLLQKRRPVHLRWVCHSLYSVKLFVHVVELFLDNVGHVKLSIVGSVHLLVDVLNLLVDGAKYSVDKTNYLFDYMKRLIGVPKLVDGLTLMVDYTKMMTLCLVCAPQDAPLSMLMSPLQRFLKSLQVASLLILFVSRN